MKRLFTAPEGVDAVHGLSSVGKVDQDGYLAFDAVNAAGLRYVLAQTTSTAAQGAIVSGNNDMGGLSLRRRAAFLPQ